MSVKPMNNVDVNGSARGGVGREWMDAVKQAQEAGIRWERPADDKRSAQEMIDESPLLKNLGNQENVKDNLMKQVSDHDNYADFEKDPDAVYRAIQVLEHIERYDAEGYRLAGGDVANGKVDGFTRDGDARHGTEAGRLKDFGEQGFSLLKGKLHDDVKVAENKDAKADAEKLGIQWQRPEGDERSASEIIEDSDLLRNLGNQSGVKDMLRDQVGDFENDADAAYRASQVLEHIETLDGEGKRIAGKDVGNGSVDGFTSSDEARAGTEAGRLQDFGKYGFAALKGELTSPSKAADDKEARAEAEKLGIKWERPEGDSRSASEIFDDNPLLKELGNHSGISDMLKERVGDFHNDADAAYRASQVLEHIETLDGEGKRLAGNEVGNGSVDGFTSSREARPNTEAGRLQDFGKHGFSALKGTLVHPDDVGGNKEAREQGEKAGIQWQRPEGDERSAGDIIDDNPLLKNLGNQSGVKDMLKNQVGDYEKDADAAFRAAQVVDRITMYDAEGKLVSGDDVANDRIDGFTSSSEARPDTEAGRLQDFGKRGFSALPAAQKVTDIQSYKDFEKANPNADEASKKIAKYTAALDQHFDSIRSKTGSGEYLTAESLKQYKEGNTHLSAETREALDFWSNPGAFEMLDNAKHSLAQTPDGDVSRNDLKQWLTDSAPKDAASSIELIKQVASDNVLANVDTSKLDGDIFTNPGNYSPEQKAAVLKDLVTAQQLIVSGGKAGMWQDDKSKVSIANHTRTHPDPKKLLDDVNKHIAILEADPSVAAYMEEHGGKAMTDLMAGKPELKDALQKTYDEKVKSGDMLNDLWKTRTSDGSTSTPASILAEFASSAGSYASALGQESAQGIREAVANSAHEGELKEFYEKQLVSGDRLTTLLKDHSFEEASSVFSVETALFNSTLDPAFTEQFDDQLNSNFTRIAQDQALENLSFDTLRSIFGKDGGDELDEEKLESIVAQIAEKSPEFLLNQDGTVTQEQAIITGVRALWDSYRQGTKFVDKATFLNPDSDVWKNVFKGPADRGAQHVISGLLLGGLTAYNAQRTGGQMNEAQLVNVVTGSVQAATLLMEGGAKGFKKFVEVNYRQTMPQLPPEDATPIQRYFYEVERDDKVMGDRLKANSTHFENAVKGVGGAAGIVLGAYGLFSATQALRSGDTLTAGLGYTASGFGALAGVAAGVESVAPILGASTRALAAIGMVSSSLGWVAGVAGTIAMIVPTLINETKQEKKVDDFEKVLGQYVTHYGIDGVEGGSFRDIPDSDWPQTDSGLS